MTPSPGADDAVPTLLTGPTAKLRGEVPAQALEAFRDAGGAVHPMLLGGCEAAGGDAAPGRRLSGIRVRSGWLPSREWPRNVGAGE